MPKINPHQSYLSFHLLDDILSPESVDPQKKIDQAVIHRIGPLVEYVLFDPQSAVPFLKHAKAPEAQQLFSILSAQNIAQSSQSRSLNAQQVEFCRVPQTESEFDEPIWVTFCKRLQSAAQNAGLLDGFANQLAGTFREMVSNTFEHSEAPESGIVGYKWKSGEFEYLVADTGIGVLESLRQHSSHTHLLDAGQALKTALSDGESRHGKNTGHGYGFRTLILNIASQKSFLRFRSGDHSHSIDGTKTASRLTKQLGVEFQGFLISVVCQT